MCGICGFNWIDKELLAEMNLSLKHRGPDDEGEYFDKGLSIGHRRLSILDLSKNAKGPMFYDKKNLVLTYNGEIYNYIELREELINKGYIFNSTSDTEVILAAYKEWGTECLNKFNGMWSFCLFDKKKKILFLSRDRFGIKPLYFYNNGEKFIFASEIKAILKVDIPRFPNDLLIYDYLMFNNVDHTNETFFKGINKLPKAHYGIYNLKTNKFLIKKYWSLTDLGTKNKTDTKYIKELFIDAVKLRLRSDVPVGSCLSGGLDSSSIICILSNSLKYDNLYTFSAVHPKYKEIDESKFMNILIRNVKVKPRFVVPDPKEALKDLNDLIYYQEEPFPGPAIYSQYKVMELAHDNKLKVLLDGQGGDELFAGYTYFFSYYFIELLKKGKFLTFLKEISSYCKIHKSMYSILALFYLIFPNYIKLLYTIKRNPFINKSFFSKYKRKSNFINDVHDSSNLNDSLLKHIEYKLEHLLKWEDRNSMRFSIETRLPFLDYRFVEYAFSLCSKLKIKNGVSKHIFRDAMVSILPKEIYNRQDKKGFETPEVWWLKDKNFSRYVHNILESKSFKSRYYFDSKKVNKLYKKFINGESRLARPIWKCVFLELWLRKFIDNK